MILSIDQGTTGTRAMLVSAEGFPVSVSYRSHRQITPQPGWVEHDPEEIARNTESTILEVLAQAAVSPQDVAAIGIANQGETVMAWDARTLVPVANAIVWQCDRTRAEVERIRRDEALSQRIHQITGLIPDAYFSASKMRWLYEEMPACRDLDRSGRLRMGTLDTWLIARLSRNTAFITDTTTASRTMLMNLRSGEWSPEMMELFGIREEWLPRIGPTAGYLATAHIDGAEVPILASAVDQQSALFGQCCFREGTAKCTFGTGAFLLMHTGTQPVWSQHGILTTVAFSDIRGPAYALDGGVYVAGAGVVWLRDQMGLIASDDEADALARSVPDSGGVCCVPSLAGLAAPYWERRARGSLVGLHTGTSRAHVVRALLEGIALRVYTVAETMTAESGQALRSPLRVDGGLTRNTFLMEFLAGILDCTLAVPECDETTALGAAYMAGLEAGIFRSQQALEQAWRPGRTFEPSMTAVERSGHIETHRRAIRHLLNWSRDEQSS